MKKPDVRERMGALIDAVELTIDAGVTAAAAIKAHFRRNRQKEYHRKYMQEWRQEHKPRRKPRVQLYLHLPPSNSKNRKAKYPIEMVEEARKMRARGYYYREIAEALNDHFKTNVSWITVRDWTQNYYRMRR